VSNKSDNLSFRVPVALRNMIENAAAIEGKSQSDYMIDAALEFVKKIEASDDINELLLPDAFKIPTDDSKMVTIRVAPKNVETVQAAAPRLYHSATRLILWASTVRAYALAEQQDKKSD